MSTEGVGAFVDFSCYVPRFRLPFGFNMKFWVVISSEINFFPLKYTFVWKSLMKRSNVAVGFLFGRRGVEMNLSPRLMIELRNFDRVVVE